MPETVNFGSVGWLIGVVCSCWQRVGVVNSNPVERNQESDVALALGTREHMRLWLLKFDRVGIGYRKGDEIEGVRLFFDALFD